MILTKEGSRQLLTSQTRPPFRADETWPERVQAWFCSLQKACASAPLAAGLHEWLWDWFILVHHLPHQSFTWDCEDDKSESLMWSKVSGSESVWVNTKGLLFPFFFHPSSPSRPRRPLPLSLSCSHIRSHRHRSPLSRYITAMCGSSWVCELGAKPHLRHCAEGADCTVTSFSLRLSFNSSSPFSSCEVTFSSCSLILQPRAAHQCICNSADWLLCCRLCGWECPQPSDRSNQEWLKKKKGKMERCEWKKGRLHLALKT